MPAPLTNRALAAIGLIGLVPLALGLMDGTLTLDVAGFRAAVLLGALALVERVVLPFRVLLLQPRRSGDGHSGPDRREAG